MLSQEAPSLNMCVSLYVCLSVHVHPCVHVRAFMCMGVC